MLTQENLDKLKEKLASATTPAHTKPLTKMGVMRALYDEIEAKSKGSWRHEDIVLWLKEQGVELSLNQFNRYLSDIRREKRLSGEAPEIGLHNPKTVVQQGAGALPKPAPVVATKVEKREEKPAAKLTAPAPVAPVAPQAVSSSDSKSDDSVWDVQKPVTDKDGFVRQRHEK